MTTTSNFGLPIYGANDVPKWSDTNTPFQNLDSKVPDKTANNIFSGTNTFDAAVTHNASLSMETGSIISSNDGVITTVRPSSDKTGTGVIRINDSYGNQLFRLRPIQHSDGKIDLDIASYPSANGGTITFNGVDIMDSYSTDEHVVGKWIDGKPLYERFVTFNNTTSVQSTGYQESNAVGYTLPSECKIKQISVDIQLNWTNPLIHANAIYIHRWNDDNNDYIVKSYFVDNKIYYGMYTHNADFSIGDLTFNVVVRYTKTTD